MAFIPPPLSGKVERKFTPPPLSGRVIDMEDVRPTDDELRLAGSVRVPEGLIPGAYETIIQLPMTAGAEPGPGALGTIGGALPALGQTIVAGLGDIGTGTLSFLAAEPDVSFTENLRHQGLNFGGLFKSGEELVKEGMERYRTGADEGEMPAISELRNLPKAARITGRAAQGLVAAAPQVAATMLAGPALGAAGRAAGLAARTAHTIGGAGAGAAVFGATEEGFDWKNAAVAAAIPFIGKYSGAIVGRTAERLGISSPQALELFNQFGGATGIAGVLTGVEEARIRQLPPEQQEEARIEQYASAIGLLAFGVGSQPKFNASPYTALLNTARNADLISPIQKPGVTGGIDPHRRIGVQVPIGANALENVPTRLVERGLEEAQSPLFIPENARGATAVEQLGMLREFGERAQAGLMLPGEPTVTPGGGVAAPQVRIESPGPSLQFPPQQPAGRVLPAVHFLEPMGSTAAAPPRPPSPPMPEQPVGVDAQGRVVNAADALRLEGPGFLQTAEDRLSIRAQGELRNLRARAAVENAQAQAGEPTRVTGPEAPSYRPPVPAPTAAESLRQKQRANVERGLTIPEQEVPPEPVVKEPFGEAPGPLPPGRPVSNKQRRKLNAAIRRGASMEVLRNILRLPPGENVLLRVWQARQGNKPLVGQTIVKPAPEKGTTTTEAGPAAEPVPKAPGPTGGAPASAGKKPRPPLYRGTTLSQWQAVQRGEQPQSGTRRAVTHGPQPVLSQRRVTLGRRERMPLS